jgi:hypothetical protein
MLQGMNVARLNYPASGGKSFRRRGFLPNGYRRPASILQMNQPGTCMEPTRFKSSVSDVVLADGRTFEFTGEGYNEPEVTDDSQKSNLFYSCDRF